jgi:hypothetical protein
MYMEFVIETGIQKPKPVRAHGGRTSHYPFADMKVGASFKVVYTSTEKADITKVERKVRAAITSFRNKDNGANKNVILSTRTVTGKEPGEKDGKPGLRVFRDPNEEATVATA